ncbi:hypothetical protein M513_02202 [Trichuris suis]|uniref:Uncharacterized protein n=1 Tax=Trichuris suis TaxID=68888 RepID=A0A085MI99_9BILA|nr:hypothetical protein M513_02202 [Trichuris suis]
MEYFSSAISTSKKNGVERRERRQADIVLKETFGTRELTLRFRMSHQPVGKYLRQMAKLKSLTRYIRDPSYSSGASDDKDSPGYLKDAPAKCFPQLTAPSVQRLVTGAYCEASHCRYSHCSHLKVSAYGLIKG